MIIETATRDRSLEEIGDLIRELFRVRSTHTATHEVFLPECDHQPWHGLVEEFCLLGHRDADRCYVVRRRGSRYPEAFFLKDDGIQNPEDAARWMILNEREDRVSETW